MYYRYKQKFLLMVLIINLLLIITVVVVVHKKTPVLAGDTNLQVQAPNNNKQIVAVGGGITSRIWSATEASYDIKKSPIFMILLPSFCTTVSDEWDHYVYHFYLAYDATDLYFSRVHNRKAFWTEFHEVIKQHCAVATGCVLHLLECAHSGRPAWAQNDAMIAAYLDGAEYFYRINDDTILSSSKWLSAFIGILNSYRPRNVGVVGPTHNVGNLKILTYDFVHRTHIEIFGFYYPRVFTDWFADDWITLVYAPQHITKLSNVTIEHRPLLGQRYFYNSAKASLLFNQIVSDRYTLARYIHHRSHSVSVPKTARVVSISVASSDLSELWGVVRNAQLIRIFFPGWTLRVYMKLTTGVKSESVLASVLSRLHTLGADIVYVDPTVTQTAAHWWSYMVADDLDVDFALVRKPNGRLSERDAVAVKDWIELCERNPHLAVHCIRDTAYQATRPVMHGLWGTRPRILNHLLGGRSLMFLIQQFVNDSNSCDGACEPSDFLSQVLWPLVQPDTIVCHEGDSVSKDVWPNSRPLPDSRLHSLALQCVGAEYDAHEQLTTTCDSDRDHLLKDQISTDSMLEFLV